MIKINTSIAHPATIFKSEVGGYRPSKLDRDENADSTIIAATNGAKTGVMVTYYTYDSKAEDKTVFIDLPELENYTARLMDNASDGDEVEFSGTYTLKPNSILFLEGR